MCALAAPDSTSVLQPAASHLNRRRRLNGSASAERTHAALVIFSMTTLLT